MTDYKKIDWADVRVGDVLMHEDGDRLTVTMTDFKGEPSLLLVGGAWRMAEHLAGAGFIPHRRVEPVPTENGAYLNAVGQLCVRMPHGSSDPDPWAVGDASGEFDDWYSDDEMRKLRPFTRLVPMPTEADVLATLHKVVPRRVVGDATINLATGAVMALLRGNETKEATDG